MSQLKPPPKDTGTAKQCAEKLTWSRDWFEHFATFPGFPSPVEYMGRDRWPILEVLKWRAENTEFIDANAPDDSEPITGDAIKTNERFLALLRREAGGHDQG